MKTDAEIILIQLTVLVLSEGKEGKDLESHQDLRDRVERFKAKAEECGDCEQLIQTIRRWIGLS